VVQPPQPAPVATFDPFIVRLPVAAIVRVAPGLTSMFLATAAVPPKMVGWLVVFGIFTSPFVASGTHAGNQLQAVFQSVLIRPVQVIFTLPGDETKGVHGLYVTTTLLLGELTQVFVPVHLAKNVLFAEIVGVLFGKATVGLDESYHVIVDGELQPVAVKVVVPETVKFDGVAVGLVGAGVELITTAVVAVAVHPLAFVTLNV
jgi:hypothetical protein